MHSFLLPVAVGASCYAARLWPSWIPDGVGAVCCLLPIIPYCLDYFFDWFERPSRPVAGVCYFVLAGLAVATGVEDRDLATAGYGVLIGLAAMFVVFEDAIQEGTWRGIPARNVLYSGMTAVVGLMGAGTLWNQSAFRAAIPLAAFPLVIGFLLNHRWTRFYGAGFCLLLAGATGDESLANTAWLPCVFLMLAGAYAFLTGVFTISSRPRDEDSDTHS